jgi:hypothetical protein
MTPLAAIVLVVMLAVIVGFVVYSVFVGGRGHATRGGDDSTTPDPTWMLQQSGATETNPTNQDTDASAAGSQHCHHHHHCDHSHSQVDTGGSHSVDSSSAGGCDTGSSGTGCSD